MLPDVHREPLTEVAVYDRGLHADSLKTSLLSTASKVTDLSPVILTTLQLGSPKFGFRALLVVERCRL